MGILFMFIISFPYSNYVLSYPFSQNSCLFQSSLVAALLLDAEVLLAPLLGFASILYFFGFSKCNLVLILMYVALIPSSVVEFTQVHYSNWVLFSIPIANNIACPCPCTYFLPCIFFSSLIIFIVLVVVILFLIFLFPCCLIFKFA
uniref:Uncharacterized protein n=1 Tax=Cacopsylla melanoneura TaxID=428564 RepID=A0A8D9E3H9_9HEMI